MAILALTMGPSLGITMLPASLSVGEPGTITFEAVGAVGSVKWRIVSSSLPAEWDSSLTPSGTSATLDTAEAEVFGTFMVTIIASDENRQPVTRTFTILVVPAPVTIASPPGEYSWIVGTPVTETLAISGGTGVYVSAEVPNLPAGVTVGIVGDDLTFSGTPTVVTASTSTTAKVTDSGGAQGVVGIDYKVTNPPRIVVVGAMTTLLGNSVDRAGRINPDGSFDIALSGWGNSTQGLAVDYQGRIVTCRTGARRLLFDGSDDPSWTILSTVGQAYRVLALADGRYVIFGAFTQVGGVPRSSIAILLSDGTLDTSFAPPTISGSLLAVAQDSSGGFVIGGAFTTINSTTHRYIARLTSTGAWDTGFVTPFGTTVGGAQVNDIKIQGNGQILVAGSNAASIRFRRLNTDGTLDTSWTYSAGARNCNCIAMDEPNNRVYCGSGNSLFLRRHSLADGSIDSAFLPTLNNTVNDVAIQPDGSIIAVGGPSMAGAGNTQIRRYTSAGVDDGTFASGIANGEIYRVALQVLS